MSKLTLSKANLKSTNLFAVIAIMALSIGLTACGNNQNTNKDSINNTDTAKVSTAQTSKAVSAKTTEASDDNAEPFAHIKEGVPVENPENFTIDGKPASLSPLAKQSSTKNTDDSLESTTAEEVAMEALMMADDIEELESEAMETTETTKKSE